MAAPTIVSALPADGATGVLLRENVEILFDQEIDEDSVSLDGNFFLTTTAYRVLRSGPAAIDYEDYLDPNVLQTSGFRGVVTGEITFQKINPDDTDIYTGEEDTAGAGDLFRTKAIFTPSQDLEPSRGYTVLVGSSVTSRTIFEVVKVGTGTGEITTSGPYLGTVEDVYTITITGAGKRDTALYRWSRASDGYTSESLTASRSYFRLVETNDVNELGIRIKFEKGTYGTGDSFSFVVKPGESIENIYAWSFTTGIVEADRPTEEATQLTKTEILSSVSLDVSDSTSSEFYVVSATPAHGAGNQPLDTNTVIFRFSKDIDEASVGSDSIRVVGVSVDNIWNNMWEEATSHTFPAMGEMEFSVDVSGKYLYVNLNYGGSAGLLLKNNEVQIYLNETITSTEDDTLDNYMYYFTTRYDPIYLDIFQIKTKIGTFLGDDFPDDIIYRLLYRYSKLADSMAGTTYFYDTTTWRMTRSEWILCWVTADLLGNLKSLFSNSTNSKRLGDLSIRYSTGITGAIDSALDDTRKCITKMEELMRLSTSKTATLAVKGIRNPEEPNFGRAIGGYSDSKLPYINTSWTTLLPAGQYASSRLSRKILGNLRRTYSNPSVIIEGE